MDKGQKKALKSATFKEMKLADLKPIPNNPRQISEQQKGFLKEGLEHFGFAGNLVVGKHTNHIIGGNQRYQLLKAEGVEKVLCAVVDIAPEDEMKLCIALNKIRGHWDEEKMLKMLDELLDLDGFELTGFDMLEAEVLLNGPDTVRAEDYSTSDAETVSFKFGDLSLKFEPKRVEAVLAQIAEKGGEDYLRKVVTSG